MMAFALGAMTLGGGTLLGCAQAFTTVPDTTAADTACTSGQAQIAVGDGYQQILCGCQESGGQVITSYQGSLTCTVPNGTVMFVHYQATTIDHQIISTGAPSFPSSDVSDSTAETTKIRVHAFTLSEAGTYTYLDAYNPGISGQFVVTP